MATPGSTNCSSAVGLSRPAAGRMCGANSSMSMAATGSPIAKEALDRIAQLYAVEKTINGSPPDRRQQRRQLQSQPIADALAAWGRQHRAPAFTQIRALFCFPLYAGAL